MFGMGENIKGCAILVGLCLLFWTAIIVLVWVLSWLS